MSRDTLDDMIDRDDTFDADIARMAEALDRDAEAAELELDAETALLASALTDDEKAGAQHWDGESDWGWGFD